MRQGSEEQERNPTRSQKRSQRIGMQSETVQEHGQKSLHF